MPTLTFRRGDSTVWTFPLEDGSGQPVDLTGATAWVDVHAAAGCVHLPLTRTAGGFDWPLNEATLGSLTARGYRASFIIQWPDGLRDRTDFTLLIEEGCP